MGMNASNSTMSTPMHPVIRPIDRGVLTRNALTARAATQEMAETTATQRADHPSAEETRDDDSRGDPAGETDSAETPEEEGYDLPMDQVFEILKNSRRRQTLHYLRENDNQATLGELAEHIAAIENDTTVQAISSSQRKRVYVGLYQCHLPKMDDTGVVEFDQHRGTIELGPNAEQLQPYLTDQSEPEWYKLYGSLAFLGVGLFALSQAGAAAYGLTAGVALVTLCVCIFACALSHARFA